MRTWKIWMKIQLNPRQHEEKGPLQMGTQKHLTDPDAQEQHSLCSYPKTDQTGIEPGR